jgi:hypothetical protein
MTANRHGEHIWGHKLQRLIAGGNEAGDGKAGQAGRKRRKYLKCRKKSYRCESLLKRNIARRKKHINQGGDQDGKSEEG